jgi:hypothetical protein
MVNETYSYISHLPLTVYRDLLSDDNHEEVLDIKMAQDGSVYVPGLTWRRVDTVDDINKVS